MKKGFTEINDRIKFALPFVLFILFYLSEAYGKISHVFGETTILQKSIKLLVLFYFIIAVILNLRKRNVFIQIIILSTFFITGQIVISNGFSTNSVVYFSKYLFPLFIFIYFNIFKLNSTSQNILFKAFEAIIIINSILILVGVVFHIKVFETYIGGRFGYNGLLRTSSTGSYVYIIALFYFLISLKDKFFSNWKSIFVFIVCFLIGTKALYLGIGAVAIIFFFLKFPKNKKSILVSFFTLFGVLAYVFFFYFGDFNRIRKAHGILSSILSYRDQLLINKTIPYINENWSFVNYLVGGVNDFTVRSQMGFIDVFLFWGILGGGIYLWTFYKTYISFKLDKIALLFIVFLIPVIFIAGNFFTYATIPLYLIIIKERVLKSQDNSYNETSNN